jgi:predicted secreted hydrolase
VSADRTMSRRAFAGGLALLGLSRRPSRAQGYAGLGQDAEGYAEVTPGKLFAFPADHGPHPDFRIEWWYVTANLTDSSGAAYGIQWTLFRQGTRPGPQAHGWASQQFWMGHAAVTRAGSHRFAETFARGGVGQAGVEVEPFSAWIDSWQMRGSEQTSARTLAPLALAAAGPDFSYALVLSADRPLVLQGDGGFSRKSQRGNQASYYYSQPFLTVTGRITLDDEPAEVTGQAWIDREWSSQPLASNQTGWDWFSLHIASGEKLMLYRMRQTDGDNYVFGNWILPDGTTRPFAGTEIVLTPKAAIEVAGRKMPVEWQVAIPELGFAIACTPLNPTSWMGTSFPYWEGPISFKGSHNGVGYLELTGY